MENIAVIRACKAVKGSAELARRINVHPTFIYHLRKGLREVPVEKCTKIERACSGQVMRWDLRPDDWWEIWPELIDRPGAPSVPAKDSEAA